MCEKWLFELLARGVQKLPKQCTLLLALHYLPKHEGKPLLLKKAFSVVTGHTESELNLI